MNRFARLLAVGFLALWTSFASAAAFTSKATGNWSASGQTTWNEVGVPATGDTVTIGNGHTITVDTNTTVGDDSTGAVVTCTGTGSLTVGPSVTFTIRGGLTIATGILSYSKNCILEMGSTAGTVNFFQSSTSCLVKCVTGGNAPSAGNTATFRKRSGATQVNVAAYYYCDYDLSYVNYVGIGASTVSCADPGAYAYAVAQLFRFDHCKFTSCGPFGSYGGNVTNNNGIFSVTHCTFLSPIADAVSWRFDGTMTTGTREFNHNVVEGQWYAYAVNGLTMNDNQFHGGIGVYGSVSGPWVSFARNLYRFPSTGGGAYLPGDVTDTYVVADAVANPHYFYGNDGWATTYDGCIIECPEQLSGDTGDFILGASGTASLYLKKTIRCIVLPISSGNVADSYSMKGLPSACLHTIFGSLPYDRRSVVHCTVIASDTVGHGILAMVGESSAPVAGNLQEASSNLVYSYGPSNDGSNTASQYAILTQSAQTDNAMVASMVKNNGLFHVLTATAPGKTNNGTGYASDTTVGTPGSGDVIGQDPNFVDRRRCLVKWGRTLIGDLGTGVNYTGATYTDAQIITQVWTAMKLYNDPSFDSRFTTAALTTFVRAGLLPQNTAYRGTAADGTDIGAVQGIPAPASSRFFYFYNLFRRRTSNDLQPIPLPDRLGSHRGFHSKRDA